MAGLAFTSCSKEDDGPEDPQGNNPTIILDCNSFKNDNPNAILLLENRNDGVDYIINCVIPVEVDLKIEPGVVIEYADSAGMIVKTEGSLNAIGSQSEPIIFTAQTKSKGAWKGVLSYSLSVKNRFDFVTIDYAGEAGLNGNGDEGSLILWKHAYFILNNVTITNGSTYGISSTYDNYNVEINNCIITGCNMPIYAEVNLASHISGGNFTGNTIDAIRLIGDSGAKVMETSHTWKDLDVPYRIANDIVIQGGGKLTIEPGVVIEFEETKGISIDKNFNEGSALIAVGTPSNPIVFTGVVKVPGSWSTIYFYRSLSVQNNIDNVLIEYAGGPGATGGAIEMWSSDPVVNVTNTTFKDIAGCAIFDHNYANDPNPNLSEGDNALVNVSGGYICYRQ